MFQGRWPNSLSLDPKNRLAIPARFRDGHKDQDGNVEFMAGILKDPCIYLHLPDQHRDFWDRINPRLGDTRDGRRAKSYFLSRFAPAHCDAQGRITLSAQLLKDASIEKDVLIIAQASRLEIWGVEQFKKLEQEVEAAGLDDVIESVFAEEKNEMRATRQQGSAHQGGDREGKTSD